VLNAIDNAGERFLYLFISFYYVTEYFTDFMIFYINIIPQRGTGKGRRIAMWRPAPISGNGSDLL